VKQYRLQIKSIYWLFKIMDDKKYALEHGKDSTGITVKHKQEVHFKKSAFTKALVAHELWHSYVASCCLSSTEDLGQDNMEEVGAEIVEFHLDDLVKHRNAIYKGLGGK
jgi:uncharacterized protein YqfB (UPF0267 family)